MKTLTDTLKQALPILKELFQTFNMERRSRKIWVFVANITNEFILRLDILCAYDASVDPECQMLHLAEEKVLQWSLGAGPQPSSLVVPMIWWYCTM
jgi:hypothetical protein